MLKRTQKELVEQLKQSEGYLFSEFELVHTGRYEISDADWNYKDVPHLRQVHKLVEGYPSYIGDDFISAILVQKVFGLKFPAVIFNYESGKHRQTYYITMLLYVLIVETTYESLGENKTQVRTRYAIGCKSRLLALLFPLARLAIQRNYHDLMSGDIPMRTRRGWLRDRGYRFKGDQKSYSFFETSLIMESNVIPPPEEKTEAIYLLDVESIPETGGLRLGEADQFGLTVFKAGQSLNFFRRLCPHEGSDLTTTCDGNHAVCPWHGRKFKPEFTLSLDDISTNATKAYGGRYTVKTLQETSKRLQVQIQVKPMQSEA